MQRVSLYMSTTTAITTAAKTVKTPLTAVLAAAATAAQAPTAAPKKEQEQEPEKAQEKAQEKEPEQEKGEVKEVANEDDDGSQDDGEGAGETAKGDGFQTVASRRGGGRGRGRANNRGAQGQRGASIRVPVPMMNRNSIGSLIMGLSRKNRDRSVNLKYVENRDQSSKYKACGFVLVRSNSNNVDEITNASKLIRAELENLLWAENNTPKREMVRRPHYERQQQQQRPQRQQQQRRRPERDERDVDVDDDHDDIYQDDGANDAVNDNRRVTRQPMPAQTASASAVRRAPRMIPHHAKPWANDDED